MIKILTVFILVAFLASGKDVNAYTSLWQIGTNKVSSDQHDDEYYKFDSTSWVDGCANIFLQKISSDLQYELEIWLLIDSLPKFAEINIAKSKFAGTILSKFSEDNKYIEPICNDVGGPPKGWKKPIKYFVSEGSLTITDWSEKESIVSVVTKNLVLTNSANEKIHLPFESFKKLRVRWMGG